MIKNTPGFLEYDFPDELSKLIINFANSKINNLWKKSLIAQEKKPNELRTSSQALFDFFPKEIKNKTFDMLAHYQNEYNKIYKHAHLNKKEKLTILKYEPNEYFEEHCDDGWGVYRTVSVIIYLNPNDYSGGETYFPNFDLYIKPKTPKIVFFPSNYVYCHKSMPVISGKKFVLVTWINDLPDGIKYKYEKNNEMI